MQRTLILKEVPLLHESPTVRIFSCYSLFFSLKASGYILHWFPIL